jgi:hypothetical protein
MPTTNAKVDTALVGAQGAYYVMARLAGLGWIPALTPRGTAGVDILAATLVAGGPQVRIQSKATTQGLRNGWLMSRKDEHPTADFYALVDLQPPVTIYILPGEVVGRFLRTDHQTWLATPGRNGQPHRDNNNRVLVGKRLLPEFQSGWLDVYRERWDSLSAGAQVSPTQNTV